MVITYTIYVSSSSKFLPDSVFMYFHLFPCVFIQNSKRVQCLCSSSQGMDESRESNIEKISRDRLLLFKWICIFWKQVVIIISFLKTSLEIVEIALCERLYSWQSFVQQRNDKYSVLTVHSNKRIRTSIIEQSSVMHEAPSPISGSKMVHRPLGPR